MNKIIKISTVVPVYYNEPSLARLHERLDAVAHSIPNSEFEFVFVDDGSRDNSFGVLRELSACDPRIKLVRLVRNFGSNAAIVAGLSYARGDCTVVISADLQDPPELICEMVAKWREGARIVLAARAGRHDPLVARLWADTFNWLFKHLVFSNFPEKGFDFFLADRDVVRVLVKTAERNMYIMGLLLWTGYNAVTLEYTRDERPFGKSRWTLGKKAKYLMDAFIGFSYLPLRLASITGIGLAFLGFAYAAFIAITKVLAGFPVEGWTSLMVVLLIVSGTQLVMLGILGEYVWRNLDETRRRPLFLVSETVGLGRAERDESDRDSEDGRQGPA